jgi:hypothetical protein
MKYAAGACGHVVMETFEDPAPRCACGQVVCGSCQEANRGVVCRYCAAKRPDGLIERKPPGVAPPPYRGRRTQTSS